jgi:hypothetical protein
MKHESGTLPNLSLNSKKKSYFPLKVSRLGSLTQLTQGGTGSRDDGQNTMRMGGTSSQSTSTTQRRRR